MIMLNSLRRATSMGLAAIVAVALLTSASQAQQAYPSPEDAAAALAAAVKTGTRSTILKVLGKDCLLYTSPSPRDRQKSRMPSSA